MSTTGEQHEGVSKTTREHRKRTRAETHSQAVAQDDNEKDVQNGDGKDYAGPPPKKRQKTALTFHEWLDPALREGGEVAGPGASDANGGDEPEGRPDIGSNNGDMEIDTPELSRADDTAVERPKKRGVSFEASTHSTSSMQYGIDFTDTVVVRVKKSAADGAYTSFVVHRNLLAASSSLFDRDLATALETLVYEDLGGPKAFNVYLHWLYTKDIGSCISETSDETQMLKSLMQCLVLGGKVESIPFQDLLMDHIIAMLHKLGRPENTVLTFLARYVCNGNPEIKLLDRFVADFLISRCPDYNTNWKGRKVREEVDIAWARARERKSAGGKALMPWEEDVCQYHVHLSAERPCYRDLEVAE